jgi:NADH-quinone oxidoreductase subunit B
MDVATTTVDKLLTWGATNSLWMFAMATSCCGIELMATAAGRVDADRMGTIIRGTPRQCDVMVVAGTITVKMAPRVLKLWEQMPEPKWCIAMGSCAISGDFYRDIYSVIPGIDTAIPVDVYIPGCPPNPEQLMAGLMRLQEKVRAVRAGEWAPKDERPETEAMQKTAPSIPRLSSPERSPDVSLAQLLDAQSLGLGGNLNRGADEAPLAAPEEAPLLAEAAETCGTEPVATENATGEDAAEAPTEDDHADA